MVGKLYVFVSNQNPWMNESSADKSSENLNKEKLTKNWEKRPNRRSKNGQLSKRQRYQERRYVLFIIVNPKLLHFPWVDFCSFIFVSSTVNRKYVHYKNLPFNGFEPRTSGFGSNRSANWATATAHEGFVWKTRKVIERLFWKRFQNSETSCLDYFSIFGHFHQM